MFNMCCCACNEYVNSTSFLSGNYTQVAGSWTFGSELTTTDADALIVNNLAVPTGYTSSWAKGSVRVFNTTDLGRFVSGYVDSDNYWFVELQSGATDGTAKLF